jgi:hypothetical protein
MKRILTLFAIASLGVAFVANAQSWTPSSIYSIGGGDITSAGVFKSDGTLIRTLWSLKPYSSGTYPVAWDGKDDLGQTVPNGTYEMRIISSNIKYSWEGTIGNMSAQKTGPTKYHALDVIHSMVNVGNMMYFTYGYNEGLASC